MTASEHLHLPWQEPMAVARILADVFGEDGLVWLDGDGGALGHDMTMAAAPVETICCRGLPGESGARNPFEALRQLTDGHWCGWLSYEAAAWTEQGNPWADDAMASLWVARHDPVLRFDVKQRRLRIEGTDGGAMQSLAKALSLTPAPEPQQLPGIPLNAWRHHTKANDFAEGVQRIRDLITAGDLFQANLTACCSTDWPFGGKALELYLQMRQQCPAPFSGLVISDNEEALLSASPERFLRVDSTGRVQTRPIKGTRPRH